MILKLLPKKPCVLQAGSTGCVFFPTGANFGRENIRAVYALVVVSSVDYIFGQSGTIIVNKLTINRRYVYINTYFELCVLLF